MDLKKKLEELKHPKDIVAEAKKLLDGLLKSYTKGETKSYRDLITGAAARHIGVLASPLKALNAIEHLYERYVKKFGFDGNFYKATLHRDP